MGCHARARLACRSQRCGVTIYLPTAQVLYAPERELLELFQKIDADDDKTVRSAAPRPSAKIARTERRRRPARSRSACCAVRMRWCAVVVFVVAIVRIRRTRCLLHVACRTWHVARCMLHVACRTLHLASGRVGRVRLIHRRDAAPVPASPSPTLGPKPSPSPHPHAAVVPLSAARPVPSLSP